MESVIIVAPHEYSAPLKQRLAANWTIYESRAGTWVIEEGNNRVYVSRNDSVRNELEPDRLSRIFASIQEPVFYTVDFSDLGLGRRVILVVADDPHLLVDNDHGVLLPGPEFIHILRNRTDWDWRRDAPR